MLGGIVREHGGVGAGGSAVEQQVPGPFTLKTGMEFLGKVIRLLSSGEVH